LSGLIGNLEDQVQARTTELVLSMAVGQRATAIRELNELLPTISEFIRELFDLYYTQVYFVDDLQQNLVLQFGTGQVGRQLLEQGHQLPIDETSIVGRVALEGKSVVVADTGQNTIHKRNSLLPDTHSELAVPLLVEGKVIGVLDMQARQAEAFTDKNTPVFEAMAVQLSGAIDSARQWDLARRTQTKLEEIVKQYTHDRWEAVLSGRNTDKALGFAYDLVKVRAANEESATAEANRLTTPLIVQNEPVGQLMVEMPPNQRLHEDTQRFLEAVGEQIAQKAETLRLFEEIQQQAGREQLTRHIADRIRSASDIETAMQTATAELAKALGAARAIIDFRLDPEASVEKSANGHGHPTAF
jgi:GAF domain-containing protein